MMEAMSSEFRCRPHSRPSRFFHLFGYIPRGPALNLSVEDAECTTTEPQRSTALLTGEVRPALVAERQNPIGATTLAG